MLHLHGEPVGNLRWDGEPVGKLRLEGAPAGNLHPRIAVNARRCPSGDRHQILAARLPGDAHMHLYPVRPGDDPDRPAMPDLPAVRALMAPLIAPRRTPWSPRHLEAVFVPADNAGLAIAVHDHFLGQPYAASSDAGFIASERAGTPVPRPGHAREDG